VVPAAALAGTAVLVLWPVLDRVGALVAVVGASAAALLLYAAMLQILGVPEARTALNILRRKST